jgi:hypothetical protein
MRAATGPMEPSAGSAVRRNETAVVAIGGAI